MKPFAAIDFEEERGLRKKDLEERAVTGVLLRLGLSGFQVSLQERPDAIVDLSRGENRVRIACEVRTLHSDDGDGGSRFRRFRGRWLRIVDEVAATLQGDGTAVPYCVVVFLEPSYDCLKGLSDASLADELVAAGRVLRTATMIEFPQPQMPILSSTVQRIRVLEADGAGLRWWPSHMQSGEVPAMDDEIIEAIETKGRLASGYHWRGATEKWLLLVAEGHGLTDVIGGVRQIALPPVPKSFPFTSVLVWDKFSEDIWAVFPQFALMCDGSHQVRHPCSLPMAVQAFATEGEHYPTRRKAR